MIWDTPGGVEAAGPGPRDRCGARAQGDDHAEKDHGEQPGEDCQVSELCSVCWVVCLCAVCVLFVFDVVDCCLLL